MTEHTVERLSEILYRHDPIGLAALGAPADEYRPEAESIIGPLREASSAADVQRVVHQEFTAWFTRDIAGEPGDYSAIAFELWGEATA